MAEKHGRHVGKTLGLDEEVGRCKQCGAAVTFSGRVQGPTGLFCSESCRTRHEEFIRKTRQLEERQQKSGRMWFWRIKRLVTTVIGKLIVLALLAGFLVVIGSIFTIPVLTPVAEWVRALLGRWW
jgi:hypothetical protein